MFSTLIIVGVLLGFCLVEFVLWALCLRLGLRWARVASVTMRRVIVATGSVFGIQLVLDVLFQLVAPSSAAQAVLVSIAAIAAAILIPCWVIMLLFSVRFLRSLQAWLPTLIPSVAMTAVALLILRPFVCETFVTPTNAMAPTLLGNHWRNTCQECGRPNYCSPVDAPEAQEVRPWMICSVFHVIKTAAVNHRVFPRDRFLAAKFLTPQRWDIIMFRYPENPATFYVMRLVGLPGETIQIEGGAVWANGKRLEIPESLGGIEYMSEIPGWPTDLWGSKDRPAVLGEDEFFVLGDFSPQSKDSRLWEQGALGHNPFAVPASYLQGVVTHIYWPPQRWRILR